MSSRERVVTRRAALLVLAMVTLAGGLPAGTAVAHDFGFTRTVVILLPENGFRIDLMVDLDALALGVPQDADNAQLVATLSALSPDDLQQTISRLSGTFERRVRLRVDGDTFRPEVLFPDFGTDRARVAGTMIGLVARLEGVFPQGAGEFSLQASRAFPPLHITFVDLRGRTLSTEHINELLQVDASATDDESSAAIADRFGDLVTSRQILERGDRSLPYRLDEPPPQPSRWEVALEYLILGFEHIIPLGLDHILFVLGLFLLNTGWRPLLAQVTAFTAAHTLSLGLATYGVVSVPASIVEPLIALSIAWIAFENIVTDELHWWRPAVVFGFGLLHGLGFAGVLAGLGLPRDEFLAALLSFNIGVETGQLAVIGAAFVVLGSFRHRDWYRRRVTIPLSLVIGLVGLYWAVERVLFA